MALGLTRAGANGASKGRVTYELKTDQEYGPDFPRLANALMTLSAKGSEEKRLLGAMLLAVLR